jgi:nucleoside-diphosphate-sugar epimerase
MSAPCILVTGFPTSFLALRVVRRLLRDSLESPLRLVVQCKSLERAKALLASMEGASPERVRVYEGDAASIDMGLSGPEWLELSREVNVVHHCMAVTYLGAEREFATAANVGGIREAVELAEAAPNFERLVHWSSALVSGAKRGYVLEEDLDASRGFRNVVEKTRFQAERIAREALDEGVPVTILRPSLIVGDSLTGEIDRLEGPYLLVTLMLNAPIDLRIPMPGPGDVKLNLVPIDFVVDAGLHIAALPEAIGETYHLVDPQPLTTRRIFELVAARTGRQPPRGFVPAGWATTLMRTPGLERFANIPRAFLEHLLTDVVYDDRHTRRALEGTGIACPPFESYADRLVQYVEDREAARRHQQVETLVDSDPLE